MLKLNDDKTELTVFTSKYKHDLFNDMSITISGTEWYVVHNLGTWVSSLIACYRYVSLYRIRQKKFTFETLTE